MFNNYSTTFGSFILVALIGLTTLTGCVTSDSSTAKASLPAMPTYDEEFRMKFADELDQICGNEERNIPQQFKNSCIFIQDALILRKQLKAIKEN